ncbi:F-box protein CPR1-like [Macadamia integrifolia]|nr:F-box protein CPR1-like [Macadamia integrifolia]
MADVNNVKISKGEAILNKNIPEDIIPDILSRIPVKPLLRFRCVCKSWCALIIDPAFVKMHLSRSLSSNNYVGLILSNGFFYAVDLDSSEPQALVQLDHQPDKFQNYVTDIVGSCNGLLCVYNNDHEEDIFLWNPSTRRHQKLPINPIKSSSLAQFVVYGFGYEPITDDYKVVRVVDSFSKEVEVNVYSLSTNSWRRVGDMPVHINAEGDHYVSGVLVNSALHWIAKGKTPYIIISFDLQDEKYREVALPDSVDDKIFMTLGVLGGQLCVVCEFWSLEFWVMKDYGVRDSWVKQFSMEEHPLVNSAFIRPICYSKNGEVILEVDIDVLVAYDPHRRRSRDLISVQDGIQTEIYIGSLVPVNAKDGTEEAGTKKEEVAEEEKE